MTKREFVATFQRLKHEMQGYQVRYIAYVAHVGYANAIEGNVAARMTRFKSWISDRKADYKKKFPAFLIGGEVIASQEHFTDFISFGEWL